MERINSTMILEKSEESALIDLKESQIKTRNLMKEYPCISLKTHFKGFENRLVEVIVNESFLQIIGYDIDTFISTILKEGFIQYLTSF